MPYLKKFPTSSTGTNAGVGTGSTWLNPNNMFATDGVMTTSAMWSKSDAGTLKASAFGYSLPPGAIIDGIQVDVIGGTFNRVQSLDVTVGNGAKTANKNYVGLLTASVIGGPTDLWGRTDWLYTDINNSAFFAQLIYNLSSSPADAIASVDSVAVTIYYHINTVAPVSDVETRETYKVFNARGEYLGNLPQPADILKINQDINSMGSQITLKIPKSADTSAEPTEVYTTEDLSQNYRTEDDAQDYTTEGVSPIVSAAFQGIDSLVKNGNVVEVWHYNYFYPNGKVMFVGKMRRWDVDFGGAGADEVTATLYSLGYDMDNYITRGSPFSYTTDQSQLNVNQYDTIFTQGGKGAGWYLYGQTWKAGVGVTTLGAVTVRLNASANVTINVYDGLGGALIGSVTQFVNTIGITGDTDIQFAFVSPLTIVPGKTYFFEVRPGDGEWAYIIFQSTNDYADGSAYTSSYAGGSGGGAWTPITGDLKFITAYAVPNTTATFTSKDPSTQMLAPIITDYNTRGGSIIWNAATIDATGLSLTYTFKVQTIYEALQAVLSLAPNGFYYYVDLGTNTIYFKNRSSTADFLFVKGVHINSLKLTTTTEASVNQILFSGGEVSPGVNLYKQYANNASILALGPLLARKSDGRVTVGATADAIGSSTLLQFSGEQYQTTVIIPHTTKLDITLLVPGKIVGFRAFGTFVDTLLLQIVRREWSAEAVTLTLGTLPVRLNTEFEQTYRALIAQQTQDNPATPS